ncbi:hypothetical protein IGI37_002204 [Enterococcus sp. AZ194]|uniref:Spy0128 family protein n=1 Tax=Enterococcus sp. AZ194 TaxID=2774629 RepID=UPI003F23CDA8
MKKSQITLFSLLTILSSVFIQPVLAVSNDLTSYSSTSALVSSEKETNETTETQEIRSSEKRESLPKETEDTAEHKTEPLVENTASDVSHLVEVKGLDVQINNGNGFTYLIKDGQLVENAPVPIPGNTIRFEYRWAIPQKSLAQMKAGDYFTFSLPNDYFSYSDTGSFPLTDLNNKEIGTSQIVNHQIKITLNKYAVSMDALKNGLVYADGRIEKSGQDIVIAIEEGITLPSIIIGEPGSSAGEYPSTLNEIITKNGVQISGKNVANWDVLVNFDNARKRFDGESYSTLNETFLVDKLEGNQLFSSIKIQTILYTATSSGNLSNNSFLYADVTQTSWGNYQIKEVMPKTTDLTIEDFKKTLKDTGQPGYGVLDNTVVVYFGNIPSDQIQLPDKYKNNNYEEIEKLLKIQLESGRITHGGYSKTLDHIRSGAEDQIIAYQVTIQADVTGDSRTLKNQAKLIHSDGENNSNIREIEFREIGGTAEVVEPKTMQIIKQDDAGNKLEGVTFKIQKWLPEKNTYEDYLANGTIGTMEITTNAKGEALFGQLTSGKYRVIETSGLDGYSAPQFSPSNEFEIGEKDISGIQIVVTNPKTKPTELALVANKSLIGRQIKEGEFQFELLDSDGKVLQTIPNSTDGKIYFEAISYEEPGDYVYTMREKPGNNENMTYDSNEYKVVVKVEDHQGQLVATPSYNGYPEFQNVYIPKKGGVVLEATKILEGRQLENNEFQFMLTDQDGKILQVRSQDTNGKIYFDPIEFETAGHYVYMIQEMSGNDEAIIYDNRIFIVTVDVEDINGTLIATPTYHGPTEFRNIYTPKKGSVVLEASKVLNGRQLRAEEFQFELVDKNGNVLQTQTNGANGKIYFNAIDYEKTGEYNYTIREKVGHDDTITYDNSEFSVTVKVTDVNGQLIATPTYSGNAEFKNIYTPKKGSVVLEASKVLEGRQLRAEEFQFELVDKEGSVLQTQTNGANEKVYFDAIDFKKAGEYNYTIREKAGNDDTITYDNSEFSVTVKVTDVNGQLIATPTYSGNAEFKNIYTPKKGSVVLEASKVLEGRQLRAEEFQFELVDKEGNVLQTQTNGANGKVYFDAIDFKKAGEYNYTIREKAGNDETITYDNTKFSVTVNVTDLDGQLVATPTYSGNAEFKNIYTPKKGSVVLEASKILDGRQLSAGEFQFELVDKKGNVLQTQTNGINGKVYFNAIDYDKAGEYNYTIREKVGNDETITYDNSEFSVTVKVTDVNGQLIATPAYSGNAEFKNIYTPKKSSVVLEASKVLNGRQLRAEEFQFELVDKEGKVLQTQTNGINGKVYFDAIDFEKAGEHNYTIREKVGNDETITYDNSEFSVTVKVTDVNGQLVATPAYSGNTEFKNIYTPKKGSIVLEASKILDGRQLSAGEFQFELVDKKGKVLQTQTNGINGKVYFDAIDFEKAGEHNYTIREKTGNDNTITYDNSEFSITVNVEDVNGQLVATPTYSGNTEFKNIYTPKKGSIVLEASKVLEGRQLCAEEFQFELVDKEGNVLQTQTNDANGKIYFNAIDYEKTGEYNYTIREKAGNDETITYDNTKFSVTVNVTDLDEQLVATPTYSGNAEFKNIYTPKKGSVVLEASKILDGRQLSAGEFQFELVDKKGNVLQTQTNGINGKVYFNAIDYDKAGEYNYTIREKAGNDETITYDNTKFSVTVNVTDLDGQLVATPTYSGNAEFKNIYTPKKGSVVLEASKILDGRQLSAGEFQFELVDKKGNVLQTQTNGINGKVYFDAIDFEKAGEHNYTIREKVGNDETITYDNSEFSVTVKVTDVNGQLVAIPTYSGNAEFKNIYTPKKGSVVLEASKILDGRQLSAGEFQFELVDKKGNVLQTQTNGINGKVYFNAIDYDKAGEYNYTIREKVGNDETITYDNTEFSVTVNVADLDGQLVATPTYSGNAEFKNIYTPKKGSVILEAGKILDGRQLSAGEFQFELVDKDGKVMQTQTNNSTGNVYFNAIGYDETGEYSYTIREKAGNDRTITYDRNEYQVTVKVKEVDGELNAIPTYNGNPTFKNSYKVGAGSVILEASKTLKGRKLSSGEFQFELVDSDGYVLQTKTNDANGKIYFNMIDYNKAGEYSYIIREKRGKDKTISYDDREHRVTVKVENTGGKLTATPSYEGKIEFKNTFTSKKGTLILTAEKTLEGRGLINGEFKFELVSENGDILQTTTNDANGKITFDPIDYNKAGEYTYIIREKMGHDETVYYDLTEHKVTVKVVNKDGKLSATLSNKAVITFENKYTQNSRNKPLTGSLILQKVDKHSGKKLVGATFELRDANNKVIQKELVTDKKGEVRINDLAAGSYQLIETKAPDGYVLDGTPIHVEVVEKSDVTVKKENTATNKTTSQTTSKALPKTGFNIGTSLLMIIVGYLLLMIVMIIGRKKSNKSDATEWD